MSTGTDEFNVYKPLGLEVLLDSHVDANLPSGGDYGDTPAIVATSNGHLKLLALLLDRGADPDKVRKDGITAAHKACQHGFVECLQLLIKRNADLNKQSVQGLTPVDIARWFKQPECLHLLRANAAYGMINEDFPIGPEAVKVCMQRLKIEYELITEIIRSDCEANMK
jgi:ankyrin repeat protein